MTPKKRKPTAAGQKSLRQIRAENKVVKKFNAELQMAVDGVDWAKVKLPRQCC
jgi:hypothetical protein